jgi:8-oxo-dGTP pyrophosphatase MutT (NUDIX family)
MTRLYLSGAAARRRRSASFYDRLAVNLEALKARLNPNPTFDSYDGISLASVLVPLVEKPPDDGWSLIFTRRSDALSRHSGEISFPGGRVDDGEDSKEAALREMQEELGVEPTAIEMIGALPPALTVVSGYQIAPWVGVVQDVPLQPNPEEIADVIVISIATLTALGARREQRFVRAGGIFTNPAFDFGPNTIWGATARILSEFLEVLD